MEGGKFPAWTSEGTATARSSPCTCAWDHSTRKGLSCSTCYSKAFGKCDPGQAHPTVALPTLTGHTQVWFKAPRVLLEASYSDHSILSCPKSCLRQEKLCSRSDYRGWVLRAQTGDPPGTYVPPLSRPFSFLPSWHREGSNVTRGSGTSGQPYF